MQKEAEKNKFERKNLYVNEKLIKTRYKIEFHKNNHYPFPRPPPRPPPLPPPPPGKNLKFKKYFSNENYLRRLFHRLHRLHDLRLKIQFELKSSLRKRK